MIFRNWLSQAEQWGLAGSLALVGVFIGGVSDRTFAQQIKPDSTLGASESSVVGPDPYLPPPSYLVKGGATRGKNLFHSFREFNIDEQESVYFENPSGIKNILTRVIGGNHSDIQGTLGVQGTANLFLINSNGIIFGPNARLDVGGSFVATTADAMQFSKEGFFSASAPDIPSPVLTINPSAFLFNQITAQPIINQSVAPNVDDRASIDGLRVLDGQSLLLVGGDIQLEGGQVRAQGGRVELGGVAGTGTIVLDDNLHLSFPPGVQRADVSFNEGAQVSASGANGRVEVQGRRITLTNGSQIRANTSGSEPKGTLRVTASESVELRGISPDGQVASGLLTQAEGAADAGDITINTKQLIIGDGAQVSASTYGQGKGGELRVNAANSVNLFGIGPRGFSSGLFTRTTGKGQGGNIIVSTAVFRVADGAVVDARTVDSARGGNIMVTADTFKAVNGGQLLAGAYKGSSGDAGNITVNTADGVTISGNLPSSAKRFIRVGPNPSNVAESDDPRNSGLFVLSRGSGDAGNLAVTARSILLNNEGTLRATTESGRGGNMTINTDTLVGIGNGDIRADANEGEGGFIKITAQGVFGLEVREPNENTSDISAVSKKDPSLNGVVEINTPDVDPSEGVVALPEGVVDASQLIAQSCPAGRGTVNGAASKFVVTGRGGLPASPSDPPRSDTVLANWITLNPEMDEKRSSLALTANLPAPTVEAQGWVRSPNGEVVLTAQVPAAPYRIGSTPASCRGS